MNNTGEFNLIVGKNIRMFRENLGYTRERFSEITDLSDKYLYEVETGKKGLSAKKLYSLASSFGVTMDFFVSARQEYNTYDLICALLKDFNEDELKCIVEIICGIKAFINLQK